MNKKLLAVAVAGALAAPGLAMAQASSVTISGIFKVGVESLSYSGTPSNSRINTSQMRVVDNSSRILFNVTEGLGSGLDAVAQLDVRFAPDQASGAPASNPIGSGNTWVGLKSNTWGRLTLGRHDLHYGSVPDDTAAKAGALEAAAISLFDYVQVVGGRGAAAVNGPIATTSRTQNVVRYDMPNMSGFDATVAWSANPLANTDSDMSLAGAGQRKGDGWNIAPKYTNGPFQVGYSYWRAKQDNPGAASLDQRGDSLYGYYKFGDFKIGLGWNKSRLDTAISVGAVGAGTKVSERTAWSLPMSYVWGPHNIVGHYTRAGNLSSSIAGAITNQTGANMFAIAYVYDLSKRTTVGLTYSKINNDQNANYNHFTSAALGSNDANPVGGESPRMLQATVRHAF